MELEHCVEKVDSLPYADFFLHFFPFFFWEMVFQEPANGYSKTIRYNMPLLATA